MHQASAVDLSALCLAVVCLVNNMAGIVDCSCPSNLKQFATGVCGIYMDGPADHICKAGARCANYGKRHGQHMFVVGRDYIYFVQGILIWTSINDAFGQTARSKAGWRDGDPRDPTFQSKVDSFQWQNDEPKEYPCAFWPPFSGKLRSYTTFCYYNIVAVCQLAFMLPKEKWAVEFKQNFPAFVNGSLFSRSVYFNYCTKEVTNVHSLLSCGFM